MATTSRKAASKNGKPEGETTPAAAVTEVTPFAREDFEPPWKADFLNGLRETAMVAGACRRAGISRQHAYRTKASDSAFAEAWGEVEEEAIDELEAVAVTRARDGDARLVEFLLKHRRPEVFRERVEVDNRAERERRELERASEEEIDRKLTGFDNVTPIRRSA